MLKMQKAFKINELRDNNDDKKNNANSLMISMT